MRRRRRLSGDMKNDPQGGRVDALCVVFSRRLMAPCRRLAGGMGAYVDGGGSSSAELPGRESGLRGGGAAFFCSALTTLAAVTRAQDAGADSGELRCRSTCTGRLSGAASESVLAKLLFAVVADDGARTIGADADAGFVG